MPTKADLTYVEKIAYKLMEEAKKGNHDAEMVYIYVQAAAAALRLLLAKAR